MWVLVAVFLLWVDFCKWVLYFLLKRKIQSWDFNIWILRSSIIYVPTQNFYMFFYKMRIIIVYKLSLEMNIIHLQTNCFLKTFSSQRSPIFKKIIHLFLKTLNYFKNKHRSLLFILFCLHASKWYLLIISCLSNIEKCKEENSNKKSLKFSPPLNKYCNRKVCSE